MTPPADAPPTLLVLAAGRSTRFGRPKALEPLGPAGETLMDYVLFDGLRAGCGRVVLVVGGDAAGDVRAHVGERLARAAIPFEAVRQRLDDLPRPHAPPPDRSKPWGTGHAVLAARDLLPGSFLVANTDDFYWPGAYRALVEHLRGRGAGGTGAGGVQEEAAAASYRLADTLRDGGGVSRALLEVDGAGRVAGVVEGKELRLSGEGVVGRTVDGRPLSLTGEEPVSMNLWGLPGSALPRLAARFSAFLEREGGDPGREFLLSEALGEEVRAGSLRMRALHQPRGGFGITFPEDVDGVRGRLARAVASEGYPAPLGPAFDALASRRPGARRGREGVR